MPQLEANEWAVERIVLADRVVMEVVAQDNRRQLVFRDVHGGQLATYLLATYPQEAHTPQRPWEDQRPWGWGRAVELGWLRRAVWLDCDVLSGHHFVVSVPDAPQDRAGAFVNLHPRQPLEAPPCERDDWRAGNLCVHLIAVLLSVGDREVVQCLRRLVPAVEGGG